MPINYITQLSNNPHTVRLMIISDYVQEVKSQLQLAVAILTCIVPYFFGQANTVILLYTIGLELRNFSIPACNS